MQHPQHSPAAVWRRWSLATNWSLTTHWRRRMPFLASVWLLAQVAAAQQVPSDPSSSHIFPAGGQRGTRVAVRVGGECLPPYTRFRLYGEGVTAPEELGSKLSSHGEPSPRRKPGESPIYYPKEWEHSVEIAADAPLGMKLWRLSCARGGTGGRPFLVGDLPEVLEQESNSVLARAQAISLPVTLNGQIEGERDLDYFQFSATEGEVVVADVLACRLGSPLEPVVELYDESGRQLSVQEYRVGSDPVLALKVPRTGNYRMMLAHLGFQGGPQYVYRVTLSTAPYVPHVFPAGRLAGTLGQFSLFALTGRDEFEVLPFSLGLAANSRGDQWLYGGMPCGNPLVLEAGSLPDLLEQEPNDSASSAGRIDEPCQVHGQFLAANDEDWFQFRATKDSLWSIECRRFPAGSASLPIVTVAQADGTPLAVSSMADDPRQPCRLEWRAPADGEYCVRLRDVQQGIRGGSDFIYRLSLQPAKPAFTLRLATDFANVVQGARGDVELKVRRVGGFTGAIDLKVESLPEGVRIEPLQIPPAQDVVRLAFVADDQARPCDVPLKILGTAVHEGQSIADKALALHLGHDAEGVSPGEPLVDHLQLTVRHKPLLRLYCSEAYQYAYRGTVYPYLMEVERLQGYNGPIHLEVADRQIKDLDGIEVQQCTIQPGQSQIMLPLYLPETMHINVQAHSNVYSQAYVVFQDAWGQKQSQLMVSEMRCMIRPLPTIVKLLAADRELVGRPGETIICRLKLERTSLFSESMAVELVEPPSSARWLDAPVTIPAGEGTVDLQLRIPAELASRTEPVPLRFRATGHLPGYVSVISEAQVSVSIQGEK